MIEKLFLAVGLVMSEAAFYIAEALRWFYLALANLLGKLNMTSCNILTHMRMTLDIGVC